MSRWPTLGSRVSMRFRQVDGGQTDVIGHLCALSPLITIRTKSDGMVSISPDDVVAVRELSHTPIRASQIRSLEHAAALAWPGTEQHWHHGWLLRAGGGHTSRANSAVPLDFSSSIADLDEIVSWYGKRGLQPWLALPDRLVPVRTEGIKQTRVMVQDLDPAGVHATATLTARPDAAWLACYQREVPPEVLTAVIDGEVVFASVAGAAVGRGAVTSAPDGTVWLGISAVHVTDTQRRSGHATAVCRALQIWGLDHGAHRAYVQVLEDNHAATALYASLGFGLHHRHRYVDARRLLTTSL
ncbi:MAG: N-acetylglutamate synthase, CG3035 family [Mycobacterium sp.]